MNDIPNPSDNDRVESVLRQWGAEEASLRAAAEAGHAPHSPAGPPAGLAQAAAATPQVIVRESSNGRWLPLAAAGVVLALGLGVLVGALALPEGPDGGGGASLAALDELRDQLADRREALRVERARIQRLEETLAARDDELRSVAEKFDTLQAAYDELQDGNGQLADLRQQLAAAASQQSQLQERLRTAEGQLQAARDEATRKLTAQKQALQSQMDQLRLALAEAKKQTAAAETKLEKYAGLEERLATSVAELKRVSDMHRQALAKITETQAQAEKLRAARDSMWTDLGRAYMSAAAPGGEGFAALKLAVQKTRLLERSGAVGGKARRQAVRTAVNQAEAILTRISFADARDRSAVRAVAQAVRKSEAIEAIDAALDVEGLEADVRGWLVEARLVLEEASHAA